MSKKNKLNKVDKLGLGDLVEELHVDKESGAVRSPTQIARLIYQRRNIKISEGPIATYLKRVEDQRSDVSRESLKENLSPHSIHSIEVIDALIRQGSKKLESTGDGAEKLGGWANAVRAQLDLIKTRLALMGIKVADSTRTDQEIFEEYESLRRRAAGVSPAPRNGSAGNAGIPGLPN